MVIQIVQEIALTQIFGFPALMWGGLATAILFLSVFIIGVGLTTGKLNVPLKWHIRIAWLAMLFALVHAIIGVMLFI